MPRLLYTYLKNVMHIFGRGQHVEGGPSPRAASQCASNRIKPYGLHGLVLWLHCVLDTTQGMAVAVSKLHGAHAVPLAIIGYPSRATRGDARLTAATRAARQATVCTVRCVAGVICQGLARGGVPCAP